jgi:hypothetical protein
MRGMYNEPEKDGHAKNGWRESGFSGIGGRERRKAKFEIGKSKFGNPWPTLRNRRWAPGG